MGGYGKTAALIAKRLNACMLGQRFGSGKNL
jgi:hypothetical protein